MPVSPLAQSLSPEATPRVQAQGQNPTPAQVLGSQPLLSVFVLFLIKVSLLGHLGGSVG